MAKHTFQKNERLTNVRIISRLFKRDNPETQKHYHFPFRVLCIYDTQQAGLPQVVFSIPKKQFKHAVDRNLLRRRCREAYRLNKEPLISLNPDSRPSYVAFLFLAKEITSYDVMEKAMQQIIRKLSLPPSGQSKNPT